MYVYMYADVYTHRMYIHYGVLGYGTCKTKSVKTCYRDDMKLEKDITIKQL